MKRFSISLLYFNHLRGGNGTTALKERCQRSSWVISLIDFGFSCFFSNIKQRGFVFLIFLYLSPPYTVQQQLFLAEIKQRPQRQASNCSLYVRTTFPPVTDGLDWKTSHVWDTVTSAASAADLKLQMTSQRAAVHNLVRHCRRWQSTSGEIWQHYVQIMASTQTWAKAVNQCDTVNILSLQRETGRNFKTSTLLFPPPQRKHSFTWTERCD